MAYLQILSLNIDNLLIFQDLEMLMPGKVWGYFHSKFEAEMRLEKK